MTLWSDGSEFPCGETKSCTAPRSLLASMEAAVLSLMPTSMFPEPFVSFAWPCVIRPIRMAPLAVVAVMLPSGAVRLAS